MAETTTSSSLPSAASQETPTPSSTPSPSSTVDISTSTPTPPSTTSSEAPPTTTPPPSTSSAVSSTTLPPTSTTASSTTSTSTQISTTSVSSSSATSSSLPTSTTAPSSTTALPTTTAPVSRSASIDPSGKTVFVTIGPTGVASVTRSSTSTSTSRGNSSSSFFSNTGAVAGTFAVVGLAALSLLVGLVILLLKRRRARKFDREIAVAAAEANIQAGRNAPFQDDYDDNYTATSGYDATGYPPSSGTHGAYAQQPMTGAAGYTSDPYAGEAAYQMRDRRSSHGTAGTAGIAGFGARGAGGGDPYADAAAHYPPEDTYYANPGPATPRGGGYATYPAGVALEHDDRSYDPYAVAGASSAGPGLVNPYARQFGGTNAPAAVAVASGVQRQQSDNHMRQRSVSEEELVDDEDAYGGTEEYEQPPRPLGSDVRRESSGSFQSENYDGGHRVLKVANE